MNAFKKMHFRFPLTLALFTCAVITGVVTSSTPARAFTLTGSFVKAGWEKTELAFDVNETSCTTLGISAADLNDSIDAAIELWNTVPTSGIKLKRGAVVTGTTNSDPPVVYCDNTMGATIGGTGSAGVNTGTGRPVIGSLKLNGLASNAAYFASLSVATRNVIVAHELGHVLGIGHSDQEAALMYYSTGVKGEMRLSQDDIDALTWLNPRDEPTDGVMGCATVQSIHGAGGGPGSGPALSMLVTLLLGSVPFWLRPASKA